MTKATTTTRIVRQPLANRISHWLVALSTFALFFSGFGQMPMYKRYGLADLPGMAWTADYHLTLTVHYLAGALLTFAVVFHIAYALMSRRFNIMPRKGDLKESAQIIAAMLGKAEEPPSHKYLAEQRVAYAFIGLTALVLVATGVVKVLKNLPGWNLDGSFLMATTMLHNVAAVLMLIGVLGHFAAFAIKANRALLPAMFDGTVDREYAEHRHPLWYAELRGETPDAGAGRAPGDPVDEAA